jgi:peroxiredoxin
MRRHLRAALAVIAVLAAAGAAFALDLGDKAPELEVTEWVQGEPLKVADGAAKDVVVVTFWATFDPDSADMLARAEKLQTKYKGKGLSVVAISTEASDEVKKFLAEHKVGFRVGIDQFHNTMAGYVPEHVRKLPYSVVVDRTGAVVYRGSPSDGMEKRIESVIGGKFDLKKELEIGKLKDELYAAQRAGEWDKVDAAAEQILAIDPGDSYAYNRRADGFRRRKDLDGYRKWVRACVDRVKDDATALSAIAWKLVDDSRLDWRDPDLALSTAKRSVDLTKSTDADLLDTYATVLGQIGLLEQAVAAEKQAVAVDAADESYKRRLAWLEACLAARQKAAPPAPPQPPKKK